MARPGNYWCSSVLLADGWAEDVHFRVNGSGAFEAVRSGIRLKDADPDTVRLDGVMLPGIPNLHSHAHQRAMAGLGELAGDVDDSFWTWRKAMYGMLARITPDQLYHIARMLYLEMLEAGYTHVAEFQYLHHDHAGRPYADRAEMTRQCARAAADTGIGFTALPVLYRFGGFGSLPPGEGQKRFINDADGFLEIVAGLEGGLEPGQQLGIAPHSLRAVDEDLLRVVLDGAPPGRPVHIHVAEQVREVDECLSFSGRRPVEWLYDQFSPGPDWCLVHATHITDGETGRMAASGAVAGLCPTTEANLGDGIFPAPAFLREGGCFGIGSDSHISVSPVEELRWLEYGQRLQHRRRNLLAGAGCGSPHTGENLLVKSALGGARACGIDGGAIRPGARADFIVLDPDLPRTVGRQRGALVDSWIFSGNDAPLTDVYVAGKPVVRDGRHPGRLDVLRRFRQTIHQLAQ